MSEFLSELAAHWDDAYWWADHQLAQAVLVGVVGLAFTVCQLGLQRRYSPRATPGGLT